METDLIKVWKSFNITEKILFVIAQTCACTLLFTLIATAWITSLILWIVAAVCVIVLTKSIEKRTGVKTSFSLVPKIRKQ